jgi:hypothetical protein
MINERSTNTMVPVDDQKDNLHVAIHDELKSSIIYGGNYSCTQDDDEQEIS